MGGLLRLLPCWRETFYLAYPPKVTLENRNFDIEGGVGRIMGCNCPNRVKKKPEGFKSFHETGGI